MDQRNGFRTSGSGQLFDDVVSSRSSRRAVLKGTMGASFASFFGGKTALRSAQARSRSALLGFPSIPMSRADTVAVPPEYAWHVVNAWGDPIVAGGAEFRHDADQSAADQAMQAGMHHDGRHRRNGQDLTYYALSRETFRGSLSDVPD